MEISKIDFDFFDFDFRFVEIHQELFAIEAYINSLEDNLPVIKKMEEQKAQTRLNKLGNDDESMESQFDRQVINEEQEKLIEEIIPRHFRNSIIVTIWAIFESAIYEIAHKAQKEQRIAIKLADINGNFLKKTELYFNHIINIPIEAQNKSWEQIKMLYIVRNAIAHANGQLANIKHEKDKSKIIEWSQQNLGILNYYGVLMLSSMFVKEAYNTVFEMTNNLINLVKEKFPQPKGAGPKNLN